MTEAADARCDQLRSGDLDSNVHGPVSASVGQRNEGPCGRSRTDRRKTFDRAPATRVGPKAGGQPLAVGARLPVGAAAHPGCVARSSPPGRDLDDLHAALDAAAKDLGAIRRGDPDTDPDVLAARLWDLHAQPGDVHAFATPMPEPS